LQYENYLRGSDICRKIYGGRNGTSSR